MGAGVRYHAQERPLDGGTTRQLEQHFGQGRNDRQDVHVPLPQLREQAGPNVGLRTDGERRPRREGEEDLVEAVVERHGHEDADHVPRLERETRLDALGREEHVAVAGDDGLRHAGAPRRVDERGHIARDDPRLGELGCDHGLRELGLRQQSELAEDRVLAHRDHRRWGAVLDDVAELERLR